MIPAQIIAAKRDGGELSQAQIAFFVNGYAQGSIPDYQMSALAMAIFLNGMSIDETTALTEQMLASGTTLTWPADSNLRVDKHSTGGVGDKVSIALAPVLACLGLQVPMLSGRGLGATGGTLDKLEAIPGLRTDLSISEIQTVTPSVGCVITGASAELAPADRKLYALRDVTATVPSIPLITASIMSKKLAESLDALVLDVKFGSGAFMKTREAATELARSLVQTGARMGVATTALLTDMNQPLGRMCGNAIEVLEAVDVLQNDGPEDVRTLTGMLAAELLLSTGRCDTIDDGLKQVDEVLSNGSAFRTFEQMVRSQGGDSTAVLDVAPAHDVVAAMSGCVAAVKTEDLGMIIIAMGGGRKKMTDCIDHTVGIEMLVRIGDRIERGQPIARLYSRQPETHLKAVQDTILVSEDASPVPLIVEKIQS